MTARDVRHAVSGRANFPQLARVRRRTAGIRIPIAVAALERDRAG
jgi:hypothetical protein